MKKFSGSSCWKERCDRSVHGNPEEWLTQCGDSIVWDHGGGQQMSLQPLCNCICWVFLFVYWVCFDMSVYYCIIGWFLSISEATIRHMNAFIIFWWFWYNFVDCKSMHVWVQFTWHFFICQRNEMISYLGIIYKLLWDCWTYIAVIEGRLKILQRLNIIILHKFIIFLEKWLNFLRLFIKYIVNNKFYFMLWKLHVSLTVCYTAAQ